MGKDHQLFSVPAGWPFYPTKRALGKEPPFASPLLLITLVFHLEFYPGWQVWECRAEGRPDLRHQEALSSDGGILFLLSSYVQMPGD